MTSQIQMRQKQNRHECKLLTGTDGWLASVMKSIVSEGRLNSQSGCTGIFTATHRHTGTW